MIRAIFLTFLSLATIVATAQVQTQVIGDSVRIHSNSGTAELNLENSTDSVLGFLYNKGNGRTQFRRGLVKINDSLYLIGADTLHMGPGGAVNGGNVFYVAKHYTGAGGAVVAGFTVASIHSSNAGYTSQLARAIPGSMILSYPDPISARNAALDAIAAGKITSAEVVVLEGNKYTFGSDDSTKNGSLNGQSPNNGTVADVGFSSASVSADSSISSLMKNNVEMYFSSGSSVTYINSSYVIYCYFDHDSTSFKSGIYGHGSFYQVFGEVNGFAAAFGYINNKNANTEFHAREVILQQWQAFYYYSFVNVIVDIENLTTADADIFVFGTTTTTGAPDTTVAATTGPRMVNIHVKNCHFGKGQTPYPDSNDWWYFVILQELNAPEGYAITINIGDFDLKCTDNFILFRDGSGITYYNVKLTVNIDNLVQRDSHLNHYSGGFGNEGLIGGYGPNYSINTSFTYNINNATIEAPLLGFINASNQSVNRNNRLNINVGQLVKNQSLFRNGIFYLCTELSGNGGEPYRIKITGNYTSHDSGAVINAVNEWYSYPFMNRYEFSGRYENTTPGMPVAYFNTFTGKLVAFSDAILINDGITPSVMADSVCSGFGCSCCSVPNTTPIIIPLYIKNVHANSTPGNNIQQVGDTIKVFAALPSFYN